MADIFISYSKQQPQPTRELADYLTSEGYSVWWDAHVTAGETFREIIDRELDAAGAVIVIWTPASIGSKWVLAEADHADQDRKLIPLRTKDVDVRYIPKPYSTYHTDVADNRAAVLAAVRRVVGVRQAKREEIESPGVVSIFETLRQEMILARWRRIAISFLFFLTLLLSPSGSSFLQQRRTGVLPVAVPRLSNGFPDI